METIIKDFVSDDPRQYRMRIGRVVASSLSGFIAGMIGGGVAVWVYLLTKTSGLE